MIQNPITHVNDNTVSCVELAILETKYSRYHINFLPCTKYICIYTISGPEFTVDSKGCDIHFINSFTCNCLFKPSTIQAWKNSTSSNPQEKEEKFPVALYLRKASESPPRIGGRKWIGLQHRRGSKPLL